MKCLLPCAAALLLLAGINQPLTTARAQGTAFTYQGRLNAAGAAVSGIYDLQFTIYGQAIGGTAVAEPVSNGATAVSNGLFTTTLDFGSGIFTGADRWLELAVRTNGTSAFTTLAPRQPLTPVPYAVFSGAANQAVSAGTADSATLAGSALVALTAGTATNLAGILPDPQLSANIARLNGTNLFTGTNRFSAALTATNPANLIAGAFAGDGGGLTNLSAASLISVGTNAGAFALGSGTTASGDYATALGYSTTASGSYATALGNSTTASGLTSTALGYNSTASGSWSTALGLVATASGNNSTALGDYATASGTAAMALGNSTTASGTYSTAVGNGTTASGLCATALGSSSRATNDFATALGYFSTAGGMYSTALGCSTIASGDYATALGNGTKARGENSTALGYQTTASGPGSTTLGLFTTASGDWSTALGYQTTASGGGSTVMGYYATATNYGCLVWSDFSTVPGAASTNANSVTMRASGGYRFFTSAAESGVFLAPGSYAWATLSDRNAKKNFSPVNGEAVLRKLAGIPVQQWNYKWEADDATPNIGPMAQDFKGAFYPGRDDKSITTLEYDGVELAAIQALNQKLAQKETELAELKARLERLENLLNPTTK